MNYHFMNVCKLSVIVLGALLIAGPSVFANKKKAVQKEEERLRTDITYLASDELEGRRTSTAGEKKAADYIEKRYKDLGIAPWKGQYRWPFDFVYGKDIDPSSAIQFNKTALKIQDDAYPLPFSASATIHTEIIKDVMEQGNFWMLPLYADTDQASNPHFEADKYMFDQATDAAKKGASGVIFYENVENQNEIKYNKMNDYEALGIPVVFIRYKTYSKYFLAPGAEKSLKLDLSVSIKKTNRRGTDIAAYIDNKAKYTVVLGAHFDHLGYGEDGNSLLANAEKEHKIHHGADDNASGTAALMEEARWVKEHSSELNHYNYLFVHFSGEELGLYGSKAFVKEQALDSNKIAYMLNMDMVGRLNDSTHALQLGGAGTSPAWAEVVQLAGDDFKLVLDSAGVGPSDHSSFYSAGIPVLFLFTLQHKDYHKPTDIASSINYPGEVKVLDYIDRILLKLDEENSKPKYLVTKSATASGARFKVSLGIMPDYSYQEGGVRVDGVTDNRPAAKAGVQKGDIIMQLGDMKISGIYPYMDALAKFKYGDKTTVKVMREGKEITLPLEFTQPAK